jgi:acyl carrier protein phosphodiesterase
LNWLAHLLLSEPTAEFRIGNLLPDLAPAGSLRDLPGEMQRGVERHRRIDAFTDAHPIVRRSMARLGPELRRYAGILTDVFYDHFLSRDWHRHCAMPLREFVQDFYACLDEHCAAIPHEAYERLLHIRQANYLCCYGELTGIREVLRRLGRRLRRPFDLSAGVPLLERQYELFHADFRTFFPDLVAEVGMGQEMRMSF